jgi:hypothetical protein
MLNDVSEVRVGSIDKEGKDEVMNMGIGTELSWIRIPTEPIVLR